MSLRIKKKSGSSVPPIDAGTYPAVCVGIVDLGVQYSETFKKYNNKVLVKRAIAREGSWVDMDKEGYVYVDGVKLEEPWLQDSLHDPGQCDIEMPYQVPEGRIFVMGDNRDVSVDSRSKSVGCIPEELLVGKLTYRVWPLENAGPVK